MHAILYLKETNIKRKVQLTFELFDINNNGSLEFSEVTTMLFAFYDILGITDNKDEEIIKKLTNTKAEKMFKFYNVNRSRTFDIDQFTKAVMSDPVIFDVLASDELLV